MSILIKLFMIKNIIKFIYPKHILVLEDDYLNKDTQVRALTHKVEYLEKSNKTLEQEASNMLDDLVRVSKELFASNAKVTTYELEFADNILPSTGISFGRTINNIKGMSQRARTTLLFRIVQILTDKEKETLIGYLNYEVKTDSSSEA
jgi:hypothetical protein